MTRKKADVPYKYKEGAIVKISNPGARYSNFTEMFKLLGMPESSGCEIFGDYKKHIYKIAKPIKHIIYNYNLYHIVSNKGSHILIGEEGIKITIERYE